VFASTVNFIGTGFVVREPLAVPSAGYSAGESAILAQGLGGLSGFGPFRDGQARGDIIFHSWARSEQGSPSWLEEVDEESTKREAALRDALNRRIDVQLNNTPLSVVLEFMGSKLQLDFIIDEKALERETLTPEEPVSISRTDARGKDILRQILEPLNLTTKIEGEAVYVTDRRCAATINRYYDLSAIFPDNTLVDDLMAAIEDSVTPDEWMNSGGLATMSVVGSILVVRASDQTHDDLAAFLREVAKQESANKKPLKREKLPEVKPKSAGKSSQENPSSESGK
jgi:hypothetical protein